MYLKINIICLNIYRNQYYLFEYIENKSKVFKNQYFVVEYLLSNALVI